MVDMRKDEQDIKGLREDIGLLTKTVQETLEAQKKEIAKHGKSTEETGTKLDKLSEEWSRKTLEIKGIEDRLGTLEKRLARPDFASSGGERKSLGQLFIESEAFKEFSKTPGATQSRIADIDLKAISSGGTGNALIETFRDPEIVEFDRARVLTIEALLNILNIDSNAATIVRQSARSILQTYLKTSVSASDTTFTPENVAGLMAGAKAKVGDEEVTIVSIDWDTGVVTCSAFSGGHSAGVKITSDRFIYTPEAELIPAGELEWTEEAVAIMELSRYIPVTEQMLEDYAQIQSLINLDLMRSLVEEREDQLFYGAGGTKQLLGLMTNTASPSYSMSTVSGDNRLDAIRRTLTLLALSRYRPSGVILNPSDKEKIDLLKGSDGHYIFVQMLLASGVNAIQQVPLIQSGGIKAGDFLAGDYEMAATLFRRRNVQISIGQPNDYFLRGKKAIKASVREGLGHKRPDAIVRGSFS